MRLFLIECLQFLLCNLRYKRPNRTDLERLTGSVFEVELKTSLARPFTTKKNCLREFRSEMDKSSIG